MVLYIVMAILSVWSIFLSFHQGCASSPLFVILESIINCTMIAEVGLRLTALGKVNSGDNRFCIWERTTVITTFFNLFVRCLL